MFQVKKKFISFECICIYSRYLFGSNIIMVKHWGDKDIIFGVLIFIKTSISGMSMKNNKSPAFLCTNKFFTKSNEYLFILMKSLPIKH